MSTIVFFIFGVLAVTAALAVVTTKNIVHSALFLGLTFAGVAVLYVLMHADFLAAVQVLVYMGAVNIMIVFAVMLTLRGDVKESSPETKNWGWGFFVSALVFLTIFVVIFTNGDWRTPITAWNQGTSAIDVSWLLFQQYMVPFEVAAILLTVALIGAVILAKGVRESK